MEENEFKVSKNHCNKCLHETNHFVIAKRVHSGSEYIDPYQQISINWSTTFTMLECCGCENVTLKKTEYFSEWEELEIEYYPPAISRQLPRWHEQLPKEIGSLLKEIYVALHADSGRLAMMGTRALVDMFMTEHLGDIGGFKQKLDKLEKEGYLSKVNKEVLDAALEAGHAAAHRGHKAKKEEVNQVIDIIENLIQYYVLKDSAESLKKTTPTRNS